MRYFSFIITIVLSLGFKFCFSQNLNHPTISSLTVQYKSLPQQSISVSQSSTTVSRVILTSTVVLIDASQVNNLNFKVINNTGGIEYDSNYNLNSNGISESNGKKVFQINGNLVYINLPIQIKQGVYQFNVSTKSAANQVSPTYTLSQ